jgi:ubiquitin carboxyl-terminal hydrolase 8
MKGLDNLGNTCYLNSILQILINTPMFPRMFSDYSKTSSESPSLEVAKSFERLIHAYIDPDPAIKTRKSLFEFVRVFHQCHNHFGYGQNDQHEYLMFLFRAIHDNMNRVSEFTIHGVSSGYHDELERESLIRHRVDGSSTTDKLLNLKDNSQLCYDSVIFRMFTGQYRSQTECQNPECMYVSNRFETFRSWELPIGNPDKTIVQLSDAMDEFVGITQLDESDSYECDKCKQRTRSLKKCTLWRLPEVLVINMKRNIYHNTGQQHVSFKDPRVVDIPKLIDMSPYVSAQRPDHHYKLYATANHMGTPTGGHCYAQIEQNGKWFVVDDNNIREGLADPSHVYLLFYQRLHGVSV